MKDSINGLIPFRHIMYKWLYDSNDGYYTNDRIGKGGDFYTSVSTSKFFGGAISRYILKMLEEEKLFLPLCIVEIGSNNADLICDIAEFLNAFNNEVFMKTTFYIIEPLKSLHNGQKEKFIQRITKRFNKKLYILESINRLNCALNHDTFFISNELFDSMPCDIVINNRMLYFKNNKLVFDRIDTTIQDFINKYNISTIEIPFFWESFIKELCSIEYKKWVFLTFDYGDFFARDMNIRIYSKHKVFNFYEEWQNNNIMNFYGNSDITYDVDFNLLKKIFESNNITIEKCITQAKFLIEECEILDIFECFMKNFSDVQLIKQKASLNGLIAPNAMGERFKALCVSNSY